MKGFIGFMAVLVVLAGIAWGAAVSPAKISLPKATTIYFGHHMTATGKVVDTLVWASDRNFKDSTNYDCAAFASGVNTTGYLTVSILNDSSIVVTSSAAGDSLKTFFYQVILKKK